RHGNLPSAFQRFVWDVLSADYPLLMPYEAKGKDGAVDHLTPLWAPSRVIVEAKYAEDGRYSTAESHWNELEEKLSIQLAGAEPVKGQTQYRVWYQGKVDEYIFVTSAKPNVPHQS